MPSPKSRTKQPPRNWRKSKISHLPASIRTELARRLQDGWSHREILKWLNRQPAVRKALKRERSGKSLAVVNFNNISNWLRSGAPELAGLNLPQP